MTTESYKTFGNSKYYEALETLKKQKPTFLKPLPFCSDEDPEYVCPFCGGILHHIGNDIYGGCCKPHNLIDLLGKYYEDEAQGERTLAIRRGFDFYGIDYGDCYDLTTDTGVLSGKEAKIQQNVDNLMSKIDIEKGSYFNVLLNEIKRSASTPKLKTGIPALDKTLGGGISGMPEMTIVMAIPSMGKTTLICQIGEHIASQSEHGYFLYFSAEQTELQMTSKSASRETLKYCLENELSTNLAKPSEYIHDGRNYCQYVEKDIEVIAAGINRSISNYNRMFIYHDSKYYFADKILEETKRMVGEIRKSDSKAQIVVAVDYLQKLYGVTGKGSQTDKQRIDTTLNCLYDIVKECQVPLFLVSSMNRNSYTKSGDMGSSSGSGQAEYDADNIWKINIPYISDVPANKVDEYIAMAKLEHPRKIVVEIPKSRNHALCPPVNLYFYSAFSYITDELDERILPVDPESVPEPDWRDEFIAPKKQNNSVGSKKNVDVAERSNSSSNLQAIFM